MVVQIVQFQLAGIDPPTYEARAEQIAPAFARLPGLIAKAWLADRERTLRRRLPLGRPRRGRGLRGRRAARGGPREPGVRELPLVDPRHARRPHGADLAGARRASPRRKRPRRLEARGIDSRRAARPAGVPARGARPRAGRPAAARPRGRAGRGVRPRPRRRRQVRRCSRRSPRTRVSVPLRSCPWTGARSSRRSEASSTRSPRGSAASPVRSQHVAAALGGQATRTVLAVDHYEALALLDDWIRQVLLPSVPDTSPPPSGRP